MRPLLILTNQTKEQSETPKRGQKKIKNTNEFFGINNGKELVHEIKRKLLPYDTKKQPIYLLQKNGKKIRLEESQDQLLSGLMVHKTARYILTFPRDISHIIS